MNTKKHNQGMALILVLFFVSIAVVVLSGLSLRLLSQGDHVTHFVMHKEAFSGLEAAIEACRAEVEHGKDGLVGLDGWSAGDSQTFTMPSFEDQGITPEYLQALPNVEYMAIAQNWAADGVDNNGDGAIDDVTEFGYYTLHGFGRNGEEHKRQAEVVVRGQNVNVWQNAIFAGSGSTSGAIKGNVSIHGSVHILGNHIPEGAEAILVLDMMGASLVHNNYERGPGQTISQRFLDSVPPLPRVIFNGEEIETINAVLRVKQGMVSINSAAEIGQPDEVANHFKETMDGVYVRDGWTGSRVADDGDRGDPSVVYSDNGWDEDYDLGDRVPFPVFADDWRWPQSVECYELGYEWAGTPGGTETSPDGDNYMHDEYFSELSDGDPYVGDVVFEFGGDDVYVNLTRPGDADPNNRVKPDPSACIAGDDYIYWDGSQNLLEMNGQVEIDGDLSFKGRPGRGGNSSAYYTGRAAILVRGDVTLDGDLIPCNDGDINDYERSYPERNCLGLMAGQNMYVGDRVSQMDIMGAFYTQGTVLCSKQTRVMGTFVANFFDMTNQVPDIYQVPELANNLPLGMIGNYPIMALSQISWREVGVEL